MAIRPDYDIGTVTLVASSANFTTTGASLQTAAVQAGDAIITPSGNVLIIASITGQNSGTLFLPCPAGAAGTNLPLRIRFQPDGSRYQGAVRNLVDLISSGNVEAFSALVGEEGKTPVFTGPGAMELRDYISDLNGNLAKLAALTLAANKILNIDASGNLTQSDITATALAVLALTGEANKFAYFTSENAAALADLTAEARTMLASTTPVVSSLGYTPANRAGDTFSGPVKLSTPATNWQLQSSFSVGLANTGGYNFATGNGMVLVTETQRYGNTAIYIFGNSVARLVSQTGAIFGESSNNNIFATHVGGDAYGIANVTGQSVTLQIMSFKTRYVG